MSETRFSVYLRLLRESKGLKQKDVANKLGDTRATYSHYENTRLTPPADAFYKIGKMYNVPIEKLIRLSLIPLNPENDPDLDPEILSLDDELFMDPVNEKKPPSDYVEVIRKMSDIHNEFLLSMNNKSKHTLAKELSTFDKELIFYYHMLPEDMQLVVIDLLRDILVRTSEN
ncbi:helix-turn-helix domain-containing protein [Butyrivibrio fibrisolvens]|uniref:helix-turn-helix domain-containing protein n=1 Tax=Butyrivibrio fibrisolvens TaxID=831 RepID=UPI0020C0BBB2|nr:helix-turn-helix transcriptional regulator [Butyrivibrio fibrisolvens]